MATATTSFAYCWWPGVAIGRSWKNPTFRAGFTLAMIILLSGTVFYRTVEGWSWVDALYFSVTTIRTVGLGDLSPQTDFGKLFTVIYIFVGVGIFVALFAQFARTMLHLEISDQHKRKSS